jgi:hypothetical protein
MAHAPPRPIGRNALAFLGALAAHVWIFHAAATQVFPSLAEGRDTDATATPVAIYPQIEPLRPNPTLDRRSRAIRAASITSRAARIASVTPLFAGVDAQLAAPLAPLQSADAAGPSDAAGGSPLDLTEQAPPPHYPIHPGYWQVVEHWPLINRTERYCVEPWNIVRFMAAPCNHIYHCVYPVQTIGADTFHFEGVITGRDQRFDVRGGGEYTPGSLHLSVIGLGHWRILPVVFNASLDGRFLGPDCPADAKRIRQR